MPFGLGAAKYTLVPNGQPSVHHDQSKNAPPPATRVTTPRARKRGAAVRYMYSQPTRARPQGSG